MAYAVACHGNLFRFPCRSRVEFQHGPAIKRDLLEEGELLPFYALVGVEHVQACSAHASLGIGRSASTFLALSQNGLDAFQDLAALYGLVEVQAEHA